MSLTGRKVGFIGLGLMGNPMARNLLKAGAEVIGFDTNAAVIEDFKGLGMHAAESVKEVAKSAPLTILMLPDTPAVEKVMEAILDCISEGSIIIDMGTTRVATTRELAPLVAAKGAEFMDAPVSGGQVGAQEGTLSIMCGCSESAFQTATPVLLAMGRNVTRVGDVGAGQVAKACNQLIVGNTICAVAEAITLARAAGVDPALVRQALSGGFASSRILEVHGQRMIDGNFVPGGRCTTQRKDMAQVVELAESLGLSLQTTSLVKVMYDTLIAEGLGDLDHSALIKMVDGSVTSTKLNP